MHDTVIVTHLNPDVDAIGSVWILKRFDKEVYRNAKVAFVPAGERLSAAKMEEFGVESQDVTHVDTGGGSFDHHDEAGADTCATKKIYEYLLGKYPDLKSDRALSRVVAFVNGTDHFESFFWPEPNHDRYVFGIEQILNGFKLGGHGDDLATVGLGCDCFDGAYSMLKLLVEAEAEIAKATEFESVFGKALAIESSNDAVMKLAQKMGYRVVVRRDPQMGNIRIKAVPVPDIDLTELYQKILTLDKVGAWYFHAGKHMLLNGSSKNLGHTATSLSLQTVVDLLSQKDNHAS